MTVYINGTTGVSGVDGSAGTPAVQGSDSNTGVFFPAADVIAFTTNGTEDARFDASGNFGIGTSSPASKLQVNGIVSSVGSGTSIFAAGETGTYTLTGVTSPNYGIAYGTLTGRPNPALTVSGYDAIAFGTNQAERARIDSSGNLLVGATSTSLAGSGLFLSANGRITISTGSGGIFANFLNASGTQIGYIQNSGNTTTTYNTLSDYRLKENIQPMTGALAKVTALKPVTYTWKADGSAGEGFIAHELAEVCPQAVTGEKDAVDAEGKPVYQGIDVSFLVGTLTAALQEQQAMIETLTARIAALEAK